MDGGRGALGECTIQPDPEGGESGSEREEVAGGGVADGRRGRGL